VFRTKALAEADARRVVQRDGYDRIAEAKELGRRAELRGGLWCQLTREDWEAIRKAGMRK
jgi:hypothetical protein